MKPIRNRKCALKVIVLSLLILTGNGIANAENPQKNKEKKGCTTFAKVNSAVIEAEQKKLMQTLDKKNISEKEKAKQKNTIENQFRNVMGRYYFFKHVCIVDSKGIMYATNDDIPDITKKIIRIAEIEIKENTPFWSMNKRLSSPDMKLSYQCYLKNKAAFDRGETISCQMDEALPEKHQAKQEKD